MKREPLACKPEVEWQSKCPGIVFTQGPTRWGGREMEPRGTGRIFCLSGEPEPLIYAPHERVWPFYFIIPWNCLEISSPHSCLLSFPSALANHSSFYQFGGGCCDQSSMCVMHRGDGLRACMWSACCSELPTVLVSLSPLEEELQRDQLPVFSNSHWLQLALPLVALHQQ